jgi:lysophospholipase L1-like esterase
MRVDENERNGLPPGIRTAIEFNTYEAPAELNIAMPPQAAACVLNIELEQFNAYVQRIEELLLADARRLLQRPEIAAGLDRVPVRQGGMVLAIGDSVTAYRRSYFALLRALVGLHRPDDGIRFANHAQSGFTTTHARRSTYRQYILEQPDLVVILLGGNDCERFAGTGAQTLVSIAEYRENLEAITRAFQENTEARLVLLSPVPVAPKLVERVSDHRRLGLSWDNGDLQACAEALRSLAFRHSLPFVDLMEVFGAPPDGRLYFADGLHPGPTGEELILKHLLAAL